MASKDLYHNLSPVTALEPKARTANEDGVTVDLQGYESALVIVHAGTITDGTHALKLQESADGTNWTDVGADDLHGSFQALASNQVQKVGYRGTKRYIRVVATVSGATNGGVYGAVVVRGHAHSLPV